MNCPTCNATGAYVGFSTVECSNSKCKHFDARMAVPKEPSCGLVNGFALKVENLEAVMKHVIFKDTTIKLVKLIPPAPYTRLIIRSVSEGIEPLRWEFKPRKIYIDYP